MQREALVTYLDDYLGCRGTTDYSDNGLQVEGGDEVTRLAFAVDACQETIVGAVAAGAQMLIVHHGLFWGKVLRIVGPHRRRVQALLDGGCSLYAAHLPLDRHPEVGNNAQLARLLGLTVVGGLGEAFGLPVGVIATATTTPERPWLPGWQQAWASPRWCCRRGRSRCSGSASSPVARPGTSRPRRLPAATPISPARPATRRTTTPLSMPSMSSTPATMPRRPWG